MSVARWDRRAGTQRCHGLVVALVVTLGPVACSGSDDSADDEPRSLQEAAEQGNGLTEITDPPGVGPVVGTDVNGQEATVVDAEVFCDGWAQFDGYRQGYLEQLATVTDLAELEAWVDDHLDAGEAGAEKVRAGMSMAGIDVAMQPTTFVVRSEDWIYKSPVELEDLQEQAVSRSEGLSGFDAAAAELC